MNQQQYCLWCGREFTPKWPGQLVCGLLCGVEQEEFERFVAEEAALCEEIGEEIVEHYCDLGGEG